MGDAFQPLPGPVGFTVVAMSASPGAIVEEIAVTTVSAAAPAPTPVPLIVRGGLRTEIGLPTVPSSARDTPRRHRLRWEKGAVSWLVVRDVVLDSQ
jgi:hypothetical protein